MSGLLIDLRRDIALLVAQANCVKNKEKHVVSG